jgi:hypothetical protein
MFDKHRGNNKVEINVGYEATPIGQDPLQDVLSLTNHYELHEVDFDYQKMLDIHGLRYSPNWSKVWLGNGQYNFSFYDRIFEAMLARNFDLTLDPIHHRAAMQIPGGFANPDFPKLARDYAIALKERHPWIKKWMPINEPALTAFMHSTQDRTWATPPHSQNYLPWKDVYLNMARAIVLITRTLKMMDPEMEFFLPEPLSNHRALNPNDPVVSAKVDFLNNTARYGMDELLNGKVHENHPWFHHLINEGATPEEINWFRDHTAVPYCRDFDYYIQQNHCWLDNETFIIDPEPAPMSELIRLHKERTPYLTFNIAETNIRGTVRDRIIWFKHVYLQCMLADIRRMTWWGLTDSDTWGDKNFANHLPKRKAPADPVGIITLSDDDVNDRRLYHRSENEFSDIVGAIVRGEMEVEDIPDYEPSGEFAKQLPAFINFNKEALDSIRASLFLCINLSIKSNLIVRRMLTGQSFLLATIPRANRAKYTLWCPHIQTKLNCEAKAR